MTVGQPWSIPARRPLTPLRCPVAGCPHVFGHTDGARLFMASGVLIRTVTLYCIYPSCTGRLTWHPGPDQR